VLNAFDGGPRNEAGFTHVDHKVLSRLCFQYWVKRLRLHPRISHHLGAILGLAKRLTRNRSHCLLVLILRYKERAPRASPETWQERFS
jgi:hypothetical protein